MERLKIILKGLWIGSTMTVPGVSGGTMAVVTGIYEDLIHAVNGLWKNPKKCLPFLLLFVAGAGAGFFVFAGFITYLLEHPAAGETTRFAFCGIVLGGIPLLVRKSGVTRLRWKDVACLAAGGVTVTLLSYIPHGLLAEGSGFLYVFLQLAGGVLVAVALILPGISVTHMLYILGLYEAVLHKVYELQWLSLLPLAAGVIGGTFLTTGVLERLMERHPRVVYQVIIGFVAGSVVMLVPPGRIAHPLWGIAAVFAGFVSMYWLSRYSTG